MVFTETLPLESNNKSNRRKEHKGKEEVNNNEALWRFLHWNSS